MKALKYSPSSLSITFNLPIRKSFQEKQQLTHNRPPYHDCHNHLSLHDLNRATALSLSRFLVDCWLIRKNTCAVYTSCYCTLILCVQNVRSAQTTSSHTKTRYVLKYTDFSSFRELFMLLFCLIYRSRSSRKSFVQLHSSTGKDRVKENSILESFRKFAVNNRFE